MNVQTAGEEKLWHAVACLPDALVAEALTYSPGSRRILRKLFVVVAVAAALLLLGCIAHTWLFAPGRGVIPAHMDTGVTVYATEERIRIGDYVLEAAVFTEDRTDPANNRLMFWWYHADQKALEVWPRIRVNGELYAFIYYRMTANSNLCCYTYTPQIREPVGPMQDGDKDVTLWIELMAGETPYSMFADGEMAQIQLTEAETNRITRIPLGGETYISFLPLTGNVFVGTFHHPSPPTPDAHWNTYLRGNFTLQYADGTESTLKGMLTMDGVQSNDGGIVSDRYDCPLERAVLDSMTMTMSHTVRVAAEEPEPVYTFPLMAVGETISCDVPVWQQDGLEIRLTSVYRDETGLRYTTEMTGSEDPLLTEADASFSFKPAYPDSGENPENHWLITCASHPDGTGEIVTDLRHNSDGSVTYASVMQEGERIHMRLTGVKLTYANPDGTPLGEVGFDTKG